MPDKAGRPSSPASTWMPTRHGRTTVLDTVAFLVDTRLSRLAGRRHRHRVAAAATRADKLAQTILARAFRGEMVPTEAELARQEGRDYEPASTMLERIRAGNSQPTQGELFPTSR